MLDDIFSGCSSQRGVFLSSGIIRLNAKIKMSEAFGHHGSKQRRGHQLRQAIPTSSTLALSVPLWDRQDANRGEWILHSVCLSVSLPDFVYSLWWEISFRGMLNRLKYQAEVCVCVGETQTGTDRETEWERELDAELQQMHLTHLQIHKTPSLLNNKSLQMACRPLPSPGLTLLKERSCMTLQRLNMQIKATV